MVFLLACALAFAGGKQEDLGDEDPPPMAEETTSAVARAAGEYGEAPMLARMVTNGELPPVEERLPEKPMVVEPINEIGKYGGTIRLPFITWPQIQHWLHESLTAFAIDRSYKTIPSLLESWEYLDDNKKIVFYMREGLKWSDGQPFTADDIMFWYEDVLLNETITPTVSGYYKRGGEVGVVEKIDEYTFSFTFAEPYPLFTTFLGSWGGLRGGQIMPKHYLSQFHPDYTDQEKIDAAMDKEGYQDWADFFGHQNDRNNPDKPSLHVWVPTNWDSEPIQVYERNPYQFRVDTAGNQLPYVDYIHSIKLEDQEAGLLKMMAGDLDQVHLGTIGGFRNYPLLMENREQGNYHLNHTADWMPNALCNIMFNFNIDDQTKSELYRQVDFRRAVSVAINRDEINKLIYKGQMIPSQIAPAFGEPYHGESEMFKVYTQHDPDLANELLDGLGMTKRDNEGYRLAPDGNRLSMIVHATTHWPSETVEVMELVAGYLEKVGLRLSVKPEQGSLWYTRHNAGEHDLSSRGSHFGGGPVPPTMNPNLFAMGGWQYAPQWALWLDTNGEQGVEPPADVKRLRELREEILIEPDRQKRIDLTMQALQIQMDNLWSIGIVVDDPHVGQRRVTTNRMKNLPEVRAGEPDSGIFAQIYMED
jgi:peptide/nickel transport system substrate-binding protein